MVMRHVLLSAILLAGLAACDLPPNLPQAYGVAAYDVRTGGFWVNGKPYVLPPDVSTNMVRSGDTVNVFYQQQGDQRVVTRIDVVERRIFQMW